MNKWIFVWCDGRVEAWAERINLVKARALVARKGHVYCSDGTVRYLIHFVKPRPTTWNPIGITSSFFWNVVPILSSPLGEYSIEAMKDIILKQVSRQLRGMVGATNSNKDRYKFALNAATTFNDLFALISDPARTFL